MTEQEIVAYLKRSETCPVLWPDEVREWAKKHKTEDIWQWMPSPDGWYSEIRWINTSITACLTSPHRLRHSFELPKPEPEIIEVAIKHNCGRLQICWNSQWIPYTAAPIIKQMDICSPDVSFAGYKYADRTVFEHPTRCYIPNTIRQPMRMEFPVAVLFRRDK